MNRCLVQFTSRAGCTRLAARHSRAISWSRTIMSATATSLPKMSFKHYPSTSPHSPDVYSFFENKTSTWQYLVVDPRTSEAVIIDTVLDYNPASGHISTGTADGILAFIAERQIKVLRILESHAHADHLTASQYFKRKLATRHGNPIPICIGERIRTVQTTFAPIYGFDSSHLENTFDVYLKDEEEFNIGSLSCRVIYLPGHTPDSVGYLIAGSMFTGDSIFMPDVGSARTDFPGGSAKDLYSSMRRLMALPDDTNLFVGHDYPVERASEECMATVSEQLRLNRHTKLGTSEKMFTRFRDARDKVLGAPALIHPALQVNIRAGKLPPADSEGRVFLKVPLKVGDDVFN
ncbi:Metallo-hydrolase/oxidoreductase [Mycena floridula]|nr:Metallo-hydrolase/oxidoreductase [Mycena floridula]